MNKTLVSILFLCLAAATASAQKDFFDKTTNVGFKYPANSKVSTNADDLVVLSDSLKGVAAVTFPTPPGFNSAGATISAGKITAEACKALSTTEGDAKPKSKKFGTTTFDMTEEVEGGMENVQPQEFYRTYHDGTCYEVRLSVGMPKYPRRKLNEQAAFAPMYSILQTMYFGSK